MSDEPPINRAERRRRARAEQKVARRASHPQHGHDPEAVMFQLRSEAESLGIGGLIGVHDLDLGSLPDGSVIFARSVFAENFDVIKNMHRVVDLTAQVCEIWSESQDDFDAAEAQALERCGLARSESGPVGVQDSKLFGTASMLVINRIALIGEAF